MSQFSSFPGFSGYNYGGYGYGIGIAAFAPEANSVEQSAVAKPVEPQGPIDPQGTYVLTGPRSYFAGYDKAPPWSLALAWQMRRHSAIVLAHAVTTAPILAGTQTIESREGTKFSDDQIKKMKEDATKDLLPLFADWLPGALETPNFGYWLQGVTWDKRERIVPIGFQNFLPGEAIIYRDKFRNFAGYKVGDEYRDSRYAFMAVHDSHFDQLFGYPRTENCRQDWWRALQSDHNGDRIERKASGIQMAIGVPTGASFSDANGKPVFPKDMAQTILDASVRGDGFTYPLTPFVKADIIRDPKLADIPAIKVEAFDWGNTAPAILAQISRADAMDRRIMRAYRRPEREAMEGHFGTKAEAGTHGAIGTTDSELLHAMLMRQFSRQVINRYLLVNYGPDAVDVLYAKAAPLADPQQQFLQEAWKTMAQNTATGPDLALRIDQQSLSHRVEVPLVSEKDYQARKDEADQQAAEKMKQQQDAMKVNAASNGNGRMNDNGEKLALSAMTSLSRIGEFLNEDDE